MPADLPDPALVVLVGASGAGKSTWAAARYRTAEIVSSDALRGVVGSGEHDLDASVEAFALLEQIVAARLRRRLTTVVDTLGTDVPRRRAWLAAARSAGLPAVAVVLDTPAAVCRARNAARDRPVPGARPRQPARGPGVRPIAARRGGLGRRRRHPAHPSPSRGSPGCADPGAATRRDPGGGASAGCAQRSPPSRVGTFHRRRAPDLALPGRRGPAPVAARDRRGGGGGRLRGPRPHGSPHPDPAGRTGVGPDPRAVGHPRRPGCVHDAARARNPRLAGDVPRARRHRQGGRHPVGTVGRSGLRRGRRRLVGAGARGIRPRVPLSRRAAGRARAARSRR